MPEVIKTYDPRQRGNSPWARFAKLAAALAVIAGAFGGIKVIVDIFNEWKPKPIEPQLRVGWLTVDDPKSLECVMAPGDTFRLQRDGITVAQALNDCYLQLKELKERSALGPQALGKSYFLYVENKGDFVESLTLHRRPASTGDQPIYRSLDRGSAIAICLGYEGRSGLSQSRMDLFHEIEVIRAQNQRSIIEVPRQDAGAPRGASDCGGVVRWNYPDQ